MEHYKRLWPYIKKYMKWTILAILCTMVVSGTSGLTAWLIKPVINELFVKKDSTLLIPLSLAVLAIFFLKGLFTYLQSYLMQYATHNAVKDLRDDVYSHIMYLPLSEYHKSSTGVLVSKMINDIGMLSRLAASVIKDLLQQTFTIIGLLIVLFNADWKMALISCSVFPFLGYFLSKYGKKMRKVSRKAQDSIAGIVNTLQETFTGARIVKTFTMEDGERERFRRENEAFTKIMIKTAKVSSRVAPSMDILGGFGVAAIIYFGGNNVISGTMNPGEFFSFTAALVMLYVPVKGLGGLHNSIQQAMASADRIFEVMDTATEQPEMHRGKAGPDGVKDAIVYSGVGFRYDGKDEVLRDVNITIKKGEVVALVGSSGGGKSTLVNLLPRFYELNSGSITIDGVDIREFNLRVLRQQIAMVTQDTILFNDTVKNNIAYGKKEYTDEMVAAAAKAAHADIFIDKLPEKYDAVVGEKGVRISGGEKQRISIARAVLKDSPILILDEATSSLDTESERIVQKALENLMKNRTTLVIAHRLSTVLNADKIVVMNKGTVADMGRHDELLSRSPIYKKLYEMQFGKAEKEHVKVN